MKKIGLMVMSLLTIVGVSVAKEKKGKGFDLTRESEVINVSAEELWSMVGSGFEDAYIWASSVDHSEGKGSANFEGATCDERACEIGAKGFDKIVEKLTNYDEKQMTLAYEVSEGMPSFMTRAMNEWTVVSVGDNQSKLIMNAEFGLKGLMGFFMKGLMKNKLNKLLATVLNDAKVYAENGHPSEAKLARINKLAKKNKI